MAKKLEIRYFDETDGVLQGLLEIKSDDLEIDFAYDFKSVPNYHGLQSNIVSEEKHEKQKEKLDQIAHRIKELIDLTREESSK